MAYLPMASGAVMSVPRSRVKARAEALVYLVLGAVLCRILTTPLPPDVAPTSSSSSSVNDQDCEEIVPKWMWNIHRHEKKVFSQNGEDGITEYLIQHVPSPGRFYVEFGTESGKETNTRILRERHNWTGLLMDGSHQNNALNLHKEMIRPDNIAELFKKYNVPNELDYLSEDTDYADYWIWKAILEANYRPRIVVSEFNSNFLPTESATVHAPPAGKVRFWDHRKNYYGVSALALKRLWNKHGYTMVYCTSTQINCFGVRNDLIHGKSPDLVQECLWRKPLAYHFRIHPMDPSNETYCWVNEDGDAVSEDYVAKFNRINAV